MHYMCVSPIKYFINFKYHIFMPKKCEGNCRDGLTFLIYFDTRAFPQLFSNTLVCTCHNLLSINLKAYNYMAGNDMIILEGLQGHYSSTTLKSISRF